MFGVYANPYIASVDAVMFSVRHRNEEGKNPERQDYESHHKENLHLRTSSSKAPRAILKTLSMMASHPAGILRKGELRFPAQVRARTLEMTLMEKDDSILCCVLPSP